MVSTAGEDSPAAQLIAEACRLRRVPVVVFVLDTPERLAEEFARRVEPGGSSDWDRFLSDCPDLADEILKLSSGFALLATGE